MKKTLIPCLLLSASLLLASCGAAGTGASKPSSGDTALTISDEALAGELLGEIDATVTIDGDTAAADGTGVTVASGTVTITAGGVYLLTGTGTTRIVVDAGEEDVQLACSDLHLTCADGPAIYIRSADDAALTLLSGTDNSLADGSSYYLTDDSSTLDAAVFSRADLTINGSGALTVEGNHQHGVVSKDDLIVAGGTLTVTAQNVGLSGKDSVTIGGACDITITAGTDGIRSDNDTDADRGTVTIEGGTVTITAGKDGIQAETALTVSGGTVEVTSGGGSGGTVADSTESYKGLKAGTSLTISGGTVTADSLDDALHTNGSATLSGGTVTLSSGDDGVHADDTLTISGGTVTVSQSYEGLEASQIDISGGTITVTARDDGVNVSGGSDGDAATGPFGADNFAATDGSLNISGGYLVIDAGGDGLDSNGSLTVSGGVTLVSGPTDNGNGVLDYNGTATVTGGVVVALGSSGMAQGFSSAENQGSFLCTFSSQSGSFAVCDSEGNVVVSFTPGKSYQCAVVTAPGLSSGETYTIVTGGTVSGADENGYAENSTISGGTAVTSLTMSSLLYKAGGAPGQMGGMPGQMDGQTGGMPGGMGTPGGGRP